MNLTEYADEMRRLSTLLDKGLDALRAQAQEVAETEATYRKAVALAWIEAPEGTAAAKSAWVDGKCADLRYARDLADNMSRAALESVRSRRTQISALQSLLNAFKEEAAFSRTGPNE